MCNQGRIENKCLRDWKSRWGFNDYRHFLWGNTNNQFTAAFPIGPCKQTPDLMKMVVGLLGRTVFRTTMKIHRHPWVFWEGSSSSVGIYVLRGSTSFFWSRPVAFTAASADGIVLIRHGTLCGACFRSTTTFNHTASAIAHRDHLAKESSSFLLMLYRISAPQHTFEGPSHLHTCHFWQINNHGF